jgi:hypothetical protein
MKVEALTFGPSLLHATTDEVARLHMNMPKICVLQVPLYII